MQSPMKPSSVLRHAAHTAGQSCGEIVEGLVTVQLMFDKSCLDTVTCEAKLHELLVQVQELFRLKTVKQTMHACLEPPTKMSN